MQRLEVIHKKACPELYINNRVEWIHLVRHTLDRIGIAPGDNKIIIHMSSSLLIISLLFLSEVLVDA